MELSVATGRAYMPDSTPEAHAIAREPLFRRPSLVSSGDCPFSTCYEELDSFFNAANTIALLAQTAFPAPDPRSSVDLLHSAVTRFVVGKPPLTVGETAWAADALLLLNVMYPSTLVVGELALLPAFAKAVPAVQQHASTDPRLCELGLSSQDLGEATAFWAAFRRRTAEHCAWSFGVAPLLTLILQHGGSHQTGQQVCASFRSALEAAVRSVWLVHSPDGVRPPPAPLDGAKSPMHIARHHLDSVFVGSKETQTLQRCAIIGLKPHSYRQVLSLMLGAKIPGVECQVAQNAGGLGLRISSDPTILDANGKERTSKSISPVQLEGPALLPMTLPLVCLVDTHSCSVAGDEAAYGTRDDKVEGAKLQKNAYDTNALLLAPVFTAIEPPLTDTERSRGGRRSVKRDDSGAETQEEMQAKQLMVECANPRMAQKVAQAMVACV